jgi:hypothetical protein
MFTVGDRGHQLRARPPLTQEDEKDLPFRPPVTFYIPWCGTQRSSDTGQKIVHALYTSKNRQLCCSSFFCMPRPVPYGPPWGIVGSGECMERAEQQGQEAASHGEVGSRLLWDAAALMLSWTTCWARAVAGCRAAAQTPGLGGRDVGRSRWGVDRRWLGRSQARRAFRRDGASKELRRVWLPTMQRRVPRMPVDLWPVLAHNAPFETSSWVRRGTLAQRYERSLAKGEETW